MAAKLQSLSLEAFVLEVGLISWHLAIKARNVCSTVRVVPTYIYTIIHVYIFLVRVTTSSPVKTIRI